ncbi:hypothetical protein Tco_1328007 [Tanacetum coccineum]
MSPSTTHQQSLADAGSETRPPMLERGPYEFKDFTHSDSEPPRKQTKDDLTEDDLKHYEAEIEATNLILISIPNDIYNFVDACTTAQAMRQRVKRLMRGTVQNKVNRETRFNNEFDQFVVEPGEALVPVYNRFAQLMNDLERNGIKFPPVTVNTKFLNCLQPEWLKYVTQVRLANRLTEDTYDDLFDYLHQYEKLVNASRAKKLEKTHDPLTLVARGAFQNNSEDPLTSAMMLLARAITQPDRVNIQSRNSGNDGRNTRRSYVQGEIFEGNNVQNDAGNTQRTLRTTSSGSAINNEAGVTLTDEKNDFLVVDASRMEEIEELSANICLMARIQPANIDFDAGPSYDFAFLSEVQTPSTSYVNPLFAKDNQEQKYSKQPKFINDTFGDDQIDRNIIFDEPNVDVNSGSVEYDNNVQKSYELEQLTRNAYKEAEKQQIIAKKVQQQNTVLTKQLESYKEKVRVFEMTTGNNTTFLTNSLRLIEKQDD